MESRLAALSAWESFYVIVGSSAGALTGLQFVVITLIRESRRNTTGAEIAAFGSPTIVHLCAALFISAALSAPWRSLLGPSITIMGCGLGGIVYGVIIARRTRKQTKYKPVFEDWLFHVLLPMVSY